MKSILAVVGISGVGKSTLIRRIANDFSLLHLQASELIKSEQVFRSAIVSTSEELRQGAVLDNQSLLIDGFRRESRGAVGLIVFDGHVVIDSRQPVIEIPSVVFQSLGCTGLIAVHDDPSQIQRRRASDVERKRPNLDVSSIEQQQNHLLSVAKRIASDIGIAYHSFAISDEDRIRKVFCEASKIG